VARTPKRSHLHFKVWFSRTIFESLLIVFSILLALGVRAWQDSREVKQLISRSMASFQEEITRNQNRIEALYQYHMGLQKVLAEMSAHAGSESKQDIDNVLDSLQSAVLLTSAWDTALATGALGEMDYNKVFVLSLTYSYQQKFQTIYNSRLDDVLDLTGNESVSAKRLSDSATRYLAEITSAEGDLLAAYGEAVRLMHGGSEEPGAEPAEPAAKE
jgi:hypothetical protein